MERNDIHSPKQIKPEDYSYVCLQVPAAPDFDAIKAVLAEREILKNHMARTGGQFSQHSHGGTCHVCGACAIYMVVYYHAASNSYIKTGFDCAQKMDMSTGNYNQFRKAIADAREAQAGKRKAAAVLFDLNLSAAWDLFDGWQARMDAEQKAFEAGNCEPRKPWCSNDEMTVHNIVSKLVKYGNISEKQVAFVRILLARIADAPRLAAEREAQRAEKAATAKDCPTGRIVVSGVVLGLKSVEDRYSYNRDAMKTNMLIETVDGYKVYGSRFENANKGDVVKFVATVNPSDRDSKFGFFKRPVRFVSDEEKAADKAATKQAKADAKLIATVAY